jgi:hypothetical protein
MSLHAWVTHEPNLFRRNRVAVWIFQLVKEVLRDALERLANSRGGKGDFCVGDYDVTMPSSAGHPGANGFAVATFTMPLEQYEYWSGITNALPLW